MPSLSELPRPLGVTDKLIIFLSHPIQHYVPWFAALHRQLGGDMKVVFACRHGLDVSVDREFGQAFAWEMDLLAGYEHEMYPSAGDSANPGGGFRGIRFPRVEEYLERERPRAVMIFGWLYAGYWEVARAASRLGIPYLLRAESNLLNKGSAPRWWLKRLTVGRLCRGAHRCLAIGQRNAELFRAYGVPEGRILMAPYFVDNDFFRQQADANRSRRAELRRGFGLPADAVVFLFMGKLIEKKHPDHLLAAWQALPEAAKARSALLFAGSGELLERLRADSAGDPRIAFPGFLNRNRLPEAYAASDVLVLPSDEGETWGLVVNEAMASGLPVVVSDRVGCAPDLVLENRTGQVFPFGDVGALRACLERMIADDDRRRNMGSTAREHVAIASVSHSVDAVSEAIRGLR